MKRFRCPACGHRNFEVKADRDRTRQCKGVAFWGTSDTGVKTVVRCRFAWLPECDPIVLADDPDVSGVFRL